MFPVLIEAIYNIFSLLPSIIGLLNSAEETSRLQNVVSILLDSLQTSNNSNDDTTIRYLKHALMILRFLANTKSSPILAFGADKAVSPLVNVITCITYIHTLTFFRFCLNITSRISMCDVLK